MSHFPMPSIKSSTKRCLRIFVALMALPVFLLWAREVRAQNPQGTAQTAVRQIRAMRIDSPIEIDGVLDEPAWEQGLVSAAFHQSKPNYGSPPSESTAVTVLYDAGNLYFGIRCYDSRPDRIEAHMTQRDDELWNDDAIEVFIDSYHDHQSCSYFVTNALGTQTDGRCTGNGTSS